MSETTTEVRVTFRGEALDVFPALHTALRDAVRDRDTLEAADLSEVILALKQGIEDQAVPLTLQRVPPHVYKAAVAANPPIPEGKARGWTCHPDKVARAILPASLIEPFELDEAGCQQLVENLPEGQWPYLRLRIMALHGEAAATKALERYADWPI